jgi:hypothetical protein
MIDLFITALTIIITVGVTAIAGVLGLYFLITKSGNRKKIVKQNYSLDKQKEIQ